MPVTELDWLVDHIGRNRFLPVPPPERQFVGDGDFLAVGAEFLRYFVTLGGLRRDHRVLDLGCGIGRMAVPLTQYLSGRAAYLGIDVVEDGIRWSQERISAQYPNFRFLHVDVRHPIYNPGGTIPAAALRLPVDDEAIDFAVAASLFTHLPASEMLDYAGEIARMLSPGGRCFCTFFVMNEANRAAVRRGGARLPFDPDGAGPEHFAYADNPLAAVAYDELWLIDRLASRGLSVVGSFHHGGWSGHEGGVSYQDLCILARAPASPRVLESGPSSAPADSAGGGAPAS